MSSLCIGYHGVHKVCFLLILMYIIMLSYIVTIADLNTFLIKLDERYEAKVKQGMLMAKKIQRIGCLSSSTPPHDAAI